VDIGDWKILDILAGCLGIIILFSIFVLLPLMLFAGGSTQALWIFLSAIQLIVHLPQLGTYFPNNIERLLARITTISNLKFIDLNPHIGIYREYWQINQQKYSDNFIHSTGLLFVYSLGIGFLVTLCY